MTSCSLETARRSAGARRVNFQVHLPLERRFAVSQLTTLRWGLTEALLGFRRCGIPAIGLHFDRLKRLGLEHALDLVQQSGLMVSTCGWIGGFTGGLEREWDEVLAEGRLLLWAASRVDAQAVTVVTGPQQMHIRTHARRLVRTALQELAPVAATYGVQLALQPMHPVCGPEWTFLHTLDDALSLLDEVAHPWVGLAYSPYHLWEEPDLLARLPSFADRIASVHFSDRSGRPRDSNDRVLPGDGRIPLAEHVAALEGAGYRGLYELDPWSRDLWNRPPYGLIADCRRRFERLCLASGASSVSSREEHSAAGPASFVGGGVRAGA